MPVGSIDTPIVGAELSGTALEIWGWVVFSGARVDFVDVYLDDERIGRAGWGYARHDIFELDENNGAEELTSGFRAVLPLPVAEQDTEHRLHVRATASDGSVWQSQPVDFTALAPEDESVVPSGLSIARIPRAERGPGRQRWCVFTHSLQLGGGELYLQELLHRVNAMQAADILVVSPLDGPLREELESMGVAVQVTAGYSVHPDEYEGRVAELALLMQAWQTDVVIVNTLALLHPVDAALRAELPVIWAIHESFPLRVFSQLCWGPGVLVPEIYARWLHALEHADAIVYEAEATLELHRSEVPGMNARRIQYGIDLDAIADYERDHARDDMRAGLGFSPDDRILLCMGVIQERKAQISLLRAFLEAAGAHPDAKLVFVGGNKMEYAQALEECVELLDTRDQVSVIDIDPDTYQWYLIADVLVSASDIESLPRSILEAQAFGLPVLAADVFGIREVVEDGTTGWLFETRRASAMIAALGRMLRLSDTELARFSQAARAASRGHSGSGYAKEYVELANQLTAGSASDVARAGA